MAPRKIETVAVISTGVIGISFIALCLARGLRVLVVSTSPEAEAQKKVEAYLAGVWPTLDPASLSPGASQHNWNVVGKSLDGFWDDVDFVQENAPESPALKHQLLADLDAHLPSHVPIASSSSGLPASKLIAQCKHHPERVLIGHPFNPPHIIPLIEVVPHPGTSEEVTEQAMEFYRSLGKKPVLVRKETPGFLANRLQAALMMEAFSLVMRNVCSAEEIDTVMTSSLGPRWAFTGPFMTAVLGGGGKPESFRRLMVHMFPGAKMWAEDMKANAFDYDPAHIEPLDASVQQMLEGVDMKAFVEQRDKKLVELFAKEDGETKK